MALNLTSTTVPRKGRYHRIDGWRGYSMPRLAIAGASDTGTWSDSPCPTPRVQAELRRFRREVLKPLGIPSRARAGGSSNAFCGKRWITVPPEMFARAAQATVDWLEKNRRSTNYIHDADLEQLGYKPNED